MAVVQRTEVHPQDHHVRRRDDRVVVRVDLRRLRPVDVSDVAVRQAVVPVRDRLVWVGHGDRAADRPEERVRVRRELPEGGQRAVRGADLRRQLAEVLAVRVDVVRRAPLGDPPQVFRAPAEAVRVPHPLAVAFGRERGEGLRRAAVVDVHGIPFRRPLDVVLA